MLAKTKNRMGRLKMDIFPHTIVRTKKAVNQVGWTAWQMNYFLSSRAMWGTVVLMLRVENQLTE